MVRQSEALAGRPGWKFDGTSAMPIEMTAKKAKRGGEDVEVAGHFIRLL